MSQKNSTKLLVTLLCSTAIGFAALGIVVPATAAEGMFDKGSKVEKPEKPEKPENNQNSGSGSNSSGSNSSGSNSSGSNSSGSNSSGSSSSSTGTSAGTTTVDTSGSTSGSSTEKTCSSTETTTTTTTTGTTKTASAGDEFNCQSAEGRAQAVTGIWTNEQSRSGWIFEASDTSLNVFYVGWNNAGAPIWYFGQLALISGQRYATFSGSMSAYAKSGDGTLSSAGDVTDVIIEFKSATEGRASFGAGEPLELHRVGRK